MHKKLLTISVWLSDSSISIVSEFVRPSGQCNWSTLYTIVTLEIQESIATRPPFTNSSNWEKRLWAVPQRIKCFIWKTAVGRLLTIKNRAKNRIMRFSNSKCRNCNAVLRGLSNSLQNYFVPNKIEATYCSVSVTELLRRNLESRDPWGQDARWCSKFMYWNLWRRRNNEILDPSFK